MRPRELAKLLEKGIGARLPILITGAPGVGKSDIVAQAAGVAGADLIVSHPAVADPTDFKGLPWPGQGGSSATFQPFGDFDQALHASRLTVWLFDDLGQSMVSVQAACMQLFLAKRVNGHVLPDCVTFVACTNRRTDRAGVSGILEPVKSRFATIVELEAHIDDWCAWAFGHGISPSMIAFLRFRPDLLSQFVASADLTNSPSPRTWNHAAKLEALGLEPGVESVAMGGAVGEGAAVEYLAFRQMAKSLVSIDAILLDPDAAAIPSKPAELYAVSVALAMKANEQNLTRVARYAERLVSAGKGEFSALMLRDAIRRTPALTHTDAFIRLASGSLGQLISGQN